MAGRLGTDLVESCGVSFRNEYALVSTPGTWLENLLGCFENKVWGVAALSLRCAFVSVINF